MPLPSDNLLFGFAPKLTDEQRIYVDSIFDNQLTIVNAKAGTGKSQPNSEKVLTPSGWVRMGDIVPGDLVISGKGVPTRVNSIHPQGLLDVYEIRFSDGSSARCSLDHLWLTQTTAEFTKQEEPKVRTTEEILETLTYRENRKNHRIPITSAVDFEHREVFLDPYVLGAILGDGTLSNNSILLSNEDEYILKEVSKRLPSDTELSYKAGCTYAIRKIFNGNARNAVSLLIESYGLLGTNAFTKFIPDDYLYNSVEVRLEVLRGLMDTDGTLDYRHGRSATFTTVSEKLKDGVVFLAQSLGGVVSVWEKTPRYRYKGELRDGGKAYEVRLNLPEEYNPFKTPKKSDIYRPNEKYKPTRLVESITKVGAEECTCISVDCESSTYLTKDFIVTHNTTLAVAAAKIIGKPLYYTFAPVEEDALGYTPGDVEEKEAKYTVPLIDALSEIREDARLALFRDSNPDFMNAAAWVTAKSHVFMRGTNLKGCTLIIDEAQNMTRGDLKKVLTRCHNDVTVIMIGHDGQNDLADPSKSGFVPYLEHFRDEPYAQICELKTNFRGVISRHADKLRW